MTTAKLSAGTRQHPIATVVHNDDQWDDPNARRVAIWAEDGKLIAQADDDAESYEIAECFEYVDLDSAIADLHQMYDSPVWDLQINEGVLLTDAESVVAVAALLKGM